MRQPDVWSVGAIKWYDVRKCIFINGRDTWVPARPEAHRAFSWLWRFKMAWLVLTGKADVLIWEE